MINKERTRGAGSNESLFDFTLDRPSKTVFINMEFAAALPMVWDAFTKAEFLDQWIAPKPFTAKTKYMDFRVGGKRFYAMISPEGEERWSLQKYTSITPKTNFKLFNAFADKEENPEEHGSDWDHSFSEQNGRTKVSITIYNESAERLERLSEGFKAGYKMSFENLSNLLAAAAQK